MYDIAHIEQKKLYKEFGVNAEYLIDHSWGRESCTIADIKTYKPKKIQFQIVKFYLKITHLQKQD